MECAHLNAVVFVYVGCPTRRYSDMILNSHLKHIYRLSEATLLTTSSVHYDKDEDNKGLDVRRVNISR